ncbi:MAG: hypothetical protein LBU14_05200 [Candidatus Peribacteria bacterium]|jgi:hypothetical protein|nr:hypothetical protein [Candidatus Peribacteria bacterium]
MANNEITELIDRIKIKTPDKIYSNKFLNKIASFIIEKKLQSINLSTETKQNIKAFLLEKYKINLKNPKNILEENIKDIFRKKQSEVRKQTDKIKIENISKKREEIKFIISKNLGSFFSRS